MKILQSALVGLTLMLGTNAPLNAQLNTSPDKGEDTYHFIARQMWGCGGVYTAMKATAPATTSPESIKAIDDALNTVAEYAAVFSKAVSFPSADQKKYYDEGFNAITKARADNDPQLFLKIRNNCIAQVKLLEDTAAKAAAQADPANDKPKKK